MRYALVIDGAVVRELAPGQPFVDADGNHNPPENLTYGLTDVQRAERGVFPIVPADPAPEGQRVASLSLSMLGGAAIETAIYEPIPLKDLKDAKLEAAAGFYFAKVLPGFPVTLNGNAETLQLRNSEDRTNWFGVLARAQIAQTAGQGAADYYPPIRTTSNARYTITNDEAVAIMTDLLDWAGQVFDAYTLIKDAIAGASNAATVNAVDLEAGYP